MADPKSTRRVPRGLVVALAIVGVLVVVFVTAAVLAGGDGYRPTGDDGEHALHARDVLTTHPPLLGMPSSISDYVHHTVFHPGPLLFIIDMPGVLLLGPAAGLLVTVVIVNIVTTGAIGFVGRRLGGAETMLVALIVTLATYLACGGPAAFYKPLNPFVVTLPLLLFIFLVCGLAAGRLTMLPAAIGVASLVVQANVSFAPTIAGLLVAAALMLWAGRRWRLTGLHTARRWAAARVVRWGGWLRRWVAVWVTFVLYAVCGGALLWPWLGSTVFLVGAALVAIALAVWVGVGVSRLPARRRSIVGWSLVVGIVCWALPGWEALTNQGGNLWDLIQYAGQGGETVANAPDKVVALALGPPVAAIRDGFTPQLLLDATLWGAAAAVVLAVVAFVRRRPRATFASRLVVLAFAAAVASAVGSRKAPEFDTTYYWIPMVSCVLWAGLALGLLERFRPQRPLPSIPALAVVGALVALPLLWRPWPLASEEPVRWAYPAVRDLTDELAALPDADYTFVTGASYDVDDVVLGVAAELDAKGDHTRFAINSAGFADHRLYIEGQTETDGILSVVPQGADVLPDGSTLVARYEPDGWDEAEVDDLALRIRRHVEATSPPVVTESQAEVALWGRLDGACLPGQGLVRRPGSCAGARPYAEDPSLFLDLDAGVWLDLYRAGVEWSTPLPADLEADLTRAHDLLALDVWLTPPANVT